MEHNGAQGAASRQWTVAAGLENTASQARTPNRAKRGARAGTESGRAKVSPMRTAPGRAGRTCCRGSAPADPPRRSAARAGLEGEGGRAQQETPRARSDAARAETTATCFDSGGGAAAATAGVRGGGGSGESAPRESRSRTTKFIYVSAAVQRKERQEVDGRNKEDEWHD